MSRLFFDTETTGLPNMKAAPGGGEKQPNICQLAAILTDNEGGVKAEMNFLITPDGWDIPPDLTKIHGITTEAAALYGISIKGALSLFARMLLNASTLVAHNIRFDLQMLEIESRRCGVSLELPKQFACTMEDSKGILKLPPTDKMKAAGMTQFKSPNLRETYRHFFGKDFEGAHDAMADVRACKDVYFHIAKTNLEAA